MKGLSGATIMLVATLCTLLPKSAWTAGNQLAAIAKANDLYQKRQYSAALPIYEKLINEGYYNGFLYYNAGNTYFRLGKLGPAILSYSRAKRLIPRDENVGANLRYAVLETSNKLLEISTPFIKNFIFWLDDFNEREYSWAVLVSNFLFWGTLLGWGTYRTPGWKRIRLGTFVFLLLVLISVGARAYTLLYYKTGVVMVDRIEVKSAQGRDNVTLFELHEGAIVRLVEEENDWVKLELRDNKMGWVLKQNLAPI